MKKYIFGARNGIYIINLEITLSCLECALAFLKKIASEGKEILFIGTKRQAQEPLRAAAEACEMPYVDQRWLGGMLTNFETVRKSVARLDLIDQMEKEGGLQFVTKKEASLLLKEREKLIKNLRGVRKMKRLPAALFVIDSKKEEIAIREARKLGIPIAAVLDTNGDPDLVDYPLPGNDDAIRAIKLFVDSVSGVIKEGRDAYKQGIANEEARKAAEDAEIAREVARVKAETEEGKAEDAAAATEEVLPDTIEEKLASKFVEEVAPITDQKVKLKKVPRKESGRGAKIK